MDRRITGLPDEQVTAWEAKLEQQVVYSLQAVMDKIAARIARIQVASAQSVRALVAVATTGPTGDDDPPPMTGELAIPEPVPLPEAIPPDIGLPPGQPYISPDDLASIAPLWQQQVADQILPLAAQVFIDSVGHVRAQILDAVAPGVTLGLPGLGSVAAEEYLARTRNTYEQIGDHLWTTARAQLSEGFEAGESIPQLAARLRQSAGLSARTGVMVARTSVIEASNAGSIAMARASKLEMQKEWIATPDLRTRPTHLAADGQRVGLNEPFVVGGYPADFPAAYTLPPSERYGCRCTQGYVMAARQPAIAQPGPPGTSAPAIERTKVLEPGEEGPLTVFYPKAPGEPGFDLGDFPEPPPIKVRSSLLRARTDRELIAAWQAEMRAITGRDIIVQLPPDASILTMREHAEGVIQMLERFPEARLRKISWYDTGSNEYAHIRTGTATLEFNAQWVSTARRREYLAQLRHDVSGWDDATGPGYGWSVRGGQRPQATSWHEMAHILSIETLGGKLKAEAMRIVLRHMTARGFTIMESVIARDISGYATKNLEEAIAEAMTDVMANGPRASLLSRELYDMVAREYRAKGFAVRTAEIPEGEAGFEEFTRETFPKAAAPRALASQTVAQLRALAKERGITRSAGTRKADLVRMLDEGGEPSSPAPVTLDLSVKTSLSAAEQARVRALVRRDPQIYATVQDRYGRVSNSGNLSEPDMVWLQEIYERDRPFVERVAQEAQIKRELATQAQKAGLTPTQFRAEEAAKLKEILDGKPVAIRVRDEAGLRDILSGGRFKTSLEGAKRGGGLVVARDRRKLGEAVMGVPADASAAERPVYGYVGIRGIEPALSPGTKDPWLAGWEGQEDLLSVYGRVTVALKPEVRARTTVTVGDSLDEIGFVRPSQIDAPSAESLGIRGIKAIERPEFTRTGYVEAQVHGGLRREDIAEVFFADEPAAATVAALQDAGIPWRVLRRTDEPVFPTTAPPVPVVPSAALTARVVAARAELQRVVDSPVVREDRLGGTSSYTFRQTTEAGEEYITKDYSRLGPGPTARRDADAEELGALVMDALDVPTQTVVRLGPERVAVSILRGDEPGFIGPLSTEAKRQVVADTDTGHLLGLGDMLLGNNDRSFNWVRLADGRPASYDLGSAFRTPKLAGAGNGDSPFSDFLLTPTRKAWAPNDMAPADLALIRQRFEALRPEFERLKRGTWWNQMMARLAEVEKRATGTRVRLAEAAGQVVSPEARAVARQAIIDERRAVADSLGEVRELLAHGASERALASRARLIAGRTTGAARKDLDALVKAMESGDADRIRVALGDVAQRRGLTELGPAGQDVVPFDPKIHEVVGGGARRPPVGTSVQVQRPGYSVRLDDGEIVQLGKAKVDTLTAEEIATRTAAQERKALREAARERNRAIEAQRGTAHLLAEVDELAAKGASKTAIRERLDPALREPGQAYAGADAAVVDTITAALDSGDLTKVRAAVTRASTKAKIKPIGRAGAKTTFDPDTMEGVGGIDIAPGAKVTVVRRGATVPGLTDPLAKAQVTPVAAPVKAAPKPRAPRKAVPSKATPAPVRLPNRDAAPITEIRQMSDAKTATAEAAKAVDGRYGGLTARVTHMDPGTGHRELKGDIYQGDRKVGYFVRYFYEAEDGGLEVEHKAIRLDPDVRGTGFATRFNENLIDWYRRSGVKRIVTQANVDVGGYTWARAGFDFREAGDLDKFMRFALTKMKVLGGTSARYPGILIDAPGMSAEKFASTYPGWDRADFEAQAAAFRAAADEVLAGRRVMSAYELSQFGRRPGQGRDDWWIGKALMLGSSWRGVLAI